MTDDLSWILVNGESLEDALADFTEDVNNPARVHARHEQIRKIYRVDSTPQVIAETEGTTDG